MLGLPQSTEVNRLVAKEKLYVNAGITSPLYAIIKNQVESFIWRNKLAESTFNVRAGETVSELQVFEVQLRQRGLDKRILPLIAGAISYKILFVLTFEGESQMWMNVSGVFYHTEWFPLDRLSLKFDGLNLDAIYENLARQLAAGRLDASEDIAEAVNRDKQRQKLEFEIVVLERKLLREKQFNKQVEMNGVLRQMRKELEENSV